MAHSHPWQKLHIPCCTGLPLNAEGSISPYLDHLKSPCPEEMVYAPWLMKNGLESLSVLLRQKSIYETLYLCTTQFFWRSPEKYVFLILLHSTFCPSLFSSGHRKHPHTCIWAYCFTNRDLPFGGWRSHWRHVLIHLPPPPHALFLWIGMSYSCPLLMGSYTVGETQRGQALRFLPQVSLYILPPPSALKKLVQEKCASGKVAPCCQWDFYPQGKPGW